MCVAFTSPCKTKLRNGPSVRLETGGRLKGKGHAVKERQGGRRKGGGGGGEERRGG